MYRTAPLGKRPRWWTELPLIAVVYGMYSAGRLLARGDVQSAVGHGLSILDLEKTFRINLEHPLNRVFTNNPVLGVPADFAYASLHYVLTPAVLVWLFRRHGEHYRKLRTWLLISTMIGLIGFTLLPTCPPRLLDPANGFVDTMQHYSSYGWWGADASAPRGFGGLTNQYAAMPSLHVGWALWCGVALWRHARHTWVKVAGAAYPLLIALVVMGTANHYFLDAVAGVGVMGLGYLLAAPALRLAGALRSRLSRSGTGESARSGTGESAGTPTTVGAGCETAAHSARSAPGAPGTRSARSARTAQPETLREADPSDPIPRQLPRQAVRGEAADNTPDGSPDGAATAAR
ncbi:phosphatase PAP2 family protein [Streptomyces orinoci]|uniref:Phosphatase PAP2 family protein n=1 Tax=Streptomyces orinoci TaxID=67339 RepID=A0ABV3JQY7_STRON|nr:phosphatase PAP2 family protein [Streptomyces orinoci]